MRSAFIFVAPILLKSHWLKIWFSTVNLIQSGFEWSWKSWKMSLAVRSEDEQVRRGPVSDLDALQLCRVADQATEEVVDQAKDQEADHQTIVHCFTSLSCWNDAETGHRGVTPYRQQCFVWAATTVIFVQSWPFLFAKSACHINSQSGKKNCDPKFISPPSNRNRDELRAILGPKHFKMAQFFLHAFLTYTKLTFCKNQWSKTTNLALSSGLKKTPPRI